MEYTLKNIKDILKNTELIYAHKKTVNEVTEYETLEEHSDRVKKYFDIINENKNIIDKVRNIVVSIFEDYGIESSYEKIDFVVNMFVNAVYLHDLGKSNPGFQLKAMGNNSFGKTQCEKNHSLLSALMFTDIYIKEIKERFKGKKLYPFVVAFAYIISRHHSDLEDANITEFGEKLSDVAEKHKVMLFNYRESIYDPESIKKIISNNIYKNLSKHMYVLTKLLYSILVACDFAATYEYMHGNEAEVINKIDKKHLTERYNNRELISKIRAKKTDNGINRLRTEIFLQSEKNLLKNINKSIYYLEAPTGSGKTNTSINIALTLLNNTEADNIFYIFPFNTLAEQTAEVMEFWKAGEDFIVMNSNTPIVREKCCDENSEYENIYFNYQLANYPVVITSHVRLFEAMFGTTRESTIWLYKLCNGIIILDEIQSYKNKLWHYFINVLKIYCDMLNIKIVIMSATLPKLSDLVNNDVSDSICNLIEGRKYFENDIFRKRVEVDFSLLERKTEPEELANIVLKKYNEHPNKKILIEFIKKARAREFYNIIKDLCRDREINIAEISGDDNKALRNKIINQIKNKEIDIVVATQVIEAGIDISMDIGFKDISIIDSDEQFMGRINRSCKETGYVYFFDCDDEKSIYRDDVRTNYTLRNTEMQRILINKEFDKYYCNVLEAINEVSNSSNYNTNLKQFEYDLSCFKYREVKKKLKLIDNNNVQIVLNYSCDIDGITYTGAEIWNQYKNLLINSKNMSYGELKIKLSIIREKLDVFTFNIMGSSKSLELHNVTEKLGGLYYFENGSDYITEDGKFDREVFNRENEGWFL